MNKPQEIPQDPKALYALVEALRHDLEYRRLVANGTVRRRLESGKADATAPHKESIDTYLVAPDEPDLLDALRPDAPAII